MARNEYTTCKELIEPALSHAGWDWQEQLCIGPGRINITGESMYDETQVMRADYVLRYSGFPLVVLEVKAASQSAADGMKQASRYARRLLLRFSLTSNGTDWILTDNDTGEFETFSVPPTPEDIVTRHGVSINWDHWKATLIGKLLNDAGLDHGIGAPLAALIFLRWADFQEAEQEAIPVFDETDYEPVLPAALHWRSWHHLPPLELAQFVRDRLLTALDQLGNSRNNPLATHLHRMAGPLRTLSQLSIETLTSLVSWVAKRPFETPIDRRHLLDAFDDLLEKTAYKYMGEFKTPTHIANLIIELAAPAAGNRIYDPCFGSAGLLTAAYDVVLNREQEGFRRRGAPALIIAGVEKHVESYVIGLTRLVLAGIDDPQLELGNSLERAPSSHPQRDGFDIVVVNPPWGMRIDPAGLDHFPVRTNDSTSLFIQHALAQLRPGGRAVLIVPQRLLSSSGPELRLRRMLVEQHTVEAVISLPGTAFLPYTGVRSGILVLRLGGPTKQIRMVNAEPYFDKGKGAQPATIRHALAQQLAQQVRAVMPSEHCWDIDVASLAEIEWDLTPRRRDQSALLMVLDSLRGKIPIVKLRECCEIQSGRSIRSDELVNEPAAEQPLVPYVRIKDIQRGQTSHGSSWLSTDAIAAFENTWKLRADDVVLSKSGTIGKVGVVRGRAVGAVAAHGLYILRPDEDRLDSHFLAAYLDSGHCRSWLNDRATGDYVRHLAKRFIDELPVPLPPIQIQQLVASEYRARGVDVLAFLPQLLTAGETDPIVEWVDTALKGLPTEIDAISETMSLELCDRLAGEVQSLVLNPAAYDRSPLGPWFQVFRTVALVLRGVMKIQRGPSLLSMLQQGVQLLQRASDRLRGHLPPERRAQTLNSILLTWLEKVIADLLADSKLVLAVQTNILHVGEMVESSLHIHNQGALPLREVQIVTKPDWGHAAFDYLTENASVTMRLWGGSPKLPGVFTITAEWSALTLDGRSVGGAREIAFNVIDAATPTPTEIIELGGSPYVCGDPIRPERNDVFFGRDELLAQIRRQIVQSGNVVLLEGNRRAGKSSILWHLAGAEAVPGWLGVYCSLQGAEGSREGVGVPTVEIFREIARSMVQSLQALGGATPLPNGSMLPAGERFGISRACQEGIGEGAPFADFREYVEVVLDVLTKHHLGLLLMLDEFDKLQEGIDNGITSPQVPENIRFLVQTYPRVSSILTGSRRLKRLREEYWSALFGLGTRFGVSALSPEAAGQLVVEPLKGQLTYSNEAIERALFLTARQPFLLQCLCNRVFDMAAQLTRRSVTLDLVEQAGDALIEDNEHFGVLWDYVHSDCRRFILALCHREAKGPDAFRLGFIQERLSSYGVEVDDETLIADLEFLRELELIELAGEASGGSYTLAIPLMGVWIDKQHDFAALQSKARSETEDQRA